MATRKDQVQISIAFLTDESKEYAKLIRENQKFIEDIQKAKKEGKDLTHVIRDMAKSGEAISKIPLDKLAPAQLISRAKQLKQVLDLIPSSAPEAKLLANEYQKINSLLAEQRVKAKGVSQAMTSIRQEQSGFSKFLNDAFAVAGGVALVDTLKSAFNALVNFGRQALAEADAQLAADAQIKTAIQSTAGIAGRSLADLKRQAEELQQVTLFGDDQTEGAQALLLTFTNIRGEIFDNTIPLVQDLATAFKQDLNSSAIQVGKALNDPIKGVTALQRVGITFTAEQKKLISSLVQTGDVAGAQTVILKELERQVGGSAKAAFEAANPLRQMTNLFGELREAAGALIVSALERIAPLVRSVATAFLDFVSVPVSETLEKERQGFNGVAVQIQNTNVGSTERTALINGLIRQYPQYLKGIDAEKVTNEQLAPILDKINKSYVVRIALQRQQEKIQPLLEREADFANDLAEKRANYNIALARGAELAGINLANINGEAAQVAAVTAALERKVQAQGRNFSLTASEEALALSRIKSTSAIALATDQQASASQRVVEAERQRQAVVEQLKQTYGELVDEAAGFEGVAGGGADGGGDGPIASTKKEAEAAAGSLAFLRKQIADVQKEIEATPGDSKALEPLIQQLQIAERALKALEERIANLKNPQADLAPSDEEIVRQLGFGTEAPSGYTDADRQAILEFNDFKLEEEKLTGEELLAFQKSLAAKKTEAQLEEDRKAEEMAQKRRDEIKDAAISSASLVASALVQIRQNSIAQEQQVALDALDREYAAKKRAAGDNQQALERLNREYERKKAAIEKEAAQKRKRTALIEATIAGALAVVKALPNPVAAIAAGVAAAAQIAVISSQKFAGGGYTGPGQGFAKDNTGHEPVGVVHANEWVSPPWMVKHPVWGPQVAALENVRRRGFADGGFTTTPTVNVTPIGAGASSTAQVSMEAYLMLAGEFRSFRNEISAWQGRLNVSYLDIEAVGSDLNSVRVDAGL